MDVITIIRNQRYLKTLMDILLTKRESTLLLRMRQINLKEEVDKSKGDFQLKSFITFKDKGVERVDE